jgi:ribosomal protein S18 acetylase RimI-like enzyme
VTDRGLAWRAEQACFNAWPALYEVVVGDWIARAVAPGVTRRSNSANPLRIDPRGTDADIAGCEAVYRSWSAPVLFRIPSLIGPDMDRRLDRLGYSHEGGTLTFYGETRSGADPGVELAARPSREWLSTKAALTGFKGRNASSYGRALARLRLPAAFVGVREDGRLAAVAYGAVHAGLLCVEGVVTDSGWRGRGLARRMLSALLGWARCSGADAACLQVEADNEPALALYRSLGLATELYRYHYRRAPPV